jgi:drug/metabolite transporter (DMT)-like permease
VIPSFFSMPVAGILLALASASIWGAADFLGGIAARRVHHFQVVALSALSGVAMLVVCAIGWREPIPPGASIVWAALAGASGGFGIAMLYRGLSLGNAALVAPTASVVGAVLPVAAGILFDGWPGGWQVAGFSSAIAGIWLVAKSAPATAASLRGLRIAVLAGLGLGGFLVLIARVPPDLVFGPLIVSRLVSLGGAIAMLSARSASLPALAASPVAVATGILDAGGNVFYVLARQHVRLDVAAVLSSLYPMSTVLLARLVLKEQMTVVQAIGVLLCLLGVALIASGAN